MQTKRRITALLAALTLFLCAGCSYRELDDLIHDAFPGEGGNATPPAVTFTPPPEDQITYQGVGGSFSAYRKYSVHADDGSDLEDEIIERGEQGLTYTLEGVQVYDSFQDAGVDEYGLMFTDETFLKNNRFILADMKASYTAPPGGETKIAADANELSGIYLTSGLAGQEEYGMPPTLAYFNLRPREDDPKFDKDHQFFFYTIEDGESVEFQVGIFCGPEYLESGNVYLEVNEIPMINDGIELLGDTARKLFVLLPKEG